VTESFYHSRNIVFILSCIFFVCDRTKNASMKVMYMLVKVHLRLVEKFS